MTLCVPCLLFFLCYPYLLSRYVETLFQTVTKNFEGEIQTLGYPKAALFSFGLALVSYNILAVVRRALGSVLNP
jgi:hypothetical protein